MRYSFKLYFRAPGPKLPRLPNSLKGGVGSGRKTLVNEIKKFGRQNASAFKQVAVNRAKAAVGDNIEGLINVIGMAGKQSLMEAVASGKGGKMKLKLKGAEVTSPSLGGTTETFYKFKHLNKGIAEKALVNGVRATLSCEGGYRVSSAINQQGVSDMGNIALTATLPPKFMRSIMGGDYYDASIPGLVAGGITVASNAAGNTSSNSRTVFESVKVETLITNQSIGTARVTIYELIAKRDNAGQGNGYIQPIQVWSPVAYWSLGLGNLSSAVAIGKFANVPLSNSVLGSVPTTSAIFGLYWKIASSYTVMLSGSASHTHNSEYSYNMGIHYLLPSVSPLIAGVTRSIMIVTQGMPGRDSTTNTTVGIAPTVLDVYHTQKYSVLSIPNNTQYSTFIDSGLDPAAVSGEFQTNPVPVNTNTNLN